MVDYTALQLYSPQHAFIRFGAPAGRPTLLPEERLMWWIAWRIRLRQQDYYTANGSFTTNIALLSNLGSWFPPLPLALDGYKPAVITTDSGVGPFVTDPAATWTRITFSFSPNCERLRGFAFSLSWRTSTIGNGFDGYFGMSTTPGLAVDASTFDPFGAVPTGFVSNVALQALYQDADPVPLDACYPTVPAVVTLQPCDRIQLPVYIWRNYSGALPALSFYLHDLNAGTYAAIPATLLHTVPNVRSSVRSLQYASLSTPTNSEYRVYSIDLPNTIAPGCYSLLATDVPLPDELAIQWYSTAFHIAHECKSTLMRYRSRESQSDFIYRDASNVTLVQGWNQVRLPMLLKDYAPTHERTSYLRSDGVSILLQERIGKTYTLETDYLPAPLHEALAIALAHDFVELYDPATRTWQPFLLTGDYTPEWPDHLHPTAPATAQLTHARYDARNPYI
jgi:hypothetical protein